MIALRLAFLLTLSLLWGCASSSKTAATKAATSANPSPNPAPTAVRVGRYGIGCRTYAQPNVVGPPSYLVSDIGKVGVPPLSRQDAATVRRIQRYVRSTTLRFAFINGAVPSFIVFDAPAGPCYDVAAGYWIMNAPTTNMYYEPGESPGFVHAVPGDDATPGPWMTPGPRQS